MFRSEKLHKIHFGSLVEDVDCGTQIAVDTAWICQQADFLADKTFETTSLEDFDPGTDGRVADERNQDKRLRAKNTPAKAGMQHIITRIKNPT